MKNNGLTKSFTNAFSGVRHTFANERNFRIHVAAGTLAVVICLFFRIETHLFVWVVFAIFTVLCSELLNTSVEALTDLYCGSQQHPLAKVAKDTAAAAVLLSSIQALAAAAAVAFSVISKWISV